jgi:hypothetical protein
MTERMMFGTVKISALRALLGASRGLSAYEIYNKMSVKAKDRKNLHTLYVASALDQPYNQCRYGKMQLLRLDRDDISADKEGQGNRGILG